MNLKFVFSLALCGLVLSCTRTVSIPTKDQVGAAVLPGEIKPVKAPFEMPVFKKPVFPDVEINIADRGAKAGEKITGIVQAAIDELSAQGGGKVVVPGGNWQSGRIILKSNVNLHFAEGAEVYFSGEVEDYQPAVFTRNEGVEMMSLGALIYAYKQDNIAVTGKGKLIGPPMDCAIREQVLKSGVIENVISADTPVEERIYTGLGGSPVLLPMFISPTSCTNVYIEGVTLERTAFWNVVPVYCDGVVIRGITVNSVGIPRGDGIDVESSRNVLIEYSTLNCGDDCFTMKAGRCEDGMRVNRPTENVVVRYCLAKKGHGGITCGSETAGMIRNLYVHDCVFDETGAGIRFKTRRNRGGGGENIVYERIRMNLTGNAFVWDMLGSRTYVGLLADRLPVRELTPLTPSYKNITAKDIIVERSSQFIKITGIPETPLTNLRLENVKAENCERLIQLRDVDQIHLKNVQVSSDDNNINVLDGRNILFEKVTFSNPEGNIVCLTEGELCRNIRFEECSPGKPENWEGTVLE
ncbi:MAG TPA: glycosyl hydrolase family 28 protein [Bacteroidales bacterium]|nr:glycosyl hydrolase family 28 protein [Bacteroidales bacterium]